MAFSDDPLLAEPAPEDPPLSDGDGVGSDGDGDGSHGGGVGSGFSGGVAQSKVLRQRTNQGKHYNIFNVPAQRFLFPWRGRWIIRGPGHPRILCRRPCNKPHVHVFMAVDLCEQRTSLILADLPFRHQGSLYRDSWFV